ncbi:MAG TPA: glycosyltransferase, partial [Armatimonadota bacterium]
DILKQNGVKATFFIVGSVADQNPGLVKRIWREGNELGNHTFTHGNMARMSTARVAVELSATQRLIQSLTGHSSRLFRAPYVADAEPQTPEEVEPILQAQRLGYVTLGETNDPEDWLPGQSAERIVSSVVSNRDVGNVVLLHDAGGDRSQTVLALPRIIRALKSQGYRFVTASQLLPGAWNQLFPTLSGRDTVLVGAAAVAFEAQFLIHVVLVGLFWISVVLGTLRVLVTAVLAIIQARRERLATFPENFRPAVSVLIAAYNEAKVIKTTVEALLRSDYPNLEVIVVDDGSKDGTARVVEEAFAQEPRLRVFHQENGGKASALNRAIAAASGEVFVMMDADTLFAPDTVSKLVRHFSDPRVGAVAGNAKVGNPVNLLTRWQSVEYITSQNFDRRAYDILNGIPVVPGSVGAWRREAVEKAGGYLGDTLAEDTELTFRVRMLGYRIRTESHAYAYTEAPTSLGNLARQRYRWAFGTLQTLWKHRGALLRRKYGAFGMVTLPALWVYQILLQAASPIVDLAVAMALLSINFKALLFYYAAFFVVELIGAALAFRLDRENPWLLIWLFWQKFVYRQLMYLVILRSLLSAAKGSSVGWGKFGRTGTVPLPGRVVGS